MPKYRRYGLMSSLTDIFFGIIWCREKKEEEVEPICQKHTQHVNANYTCSYCMEVIAHVLYSGCFTLKNDMSKQAVYTWYTPITYIFITTLHSLNNPMK